MVKSSIFKLRTTIYKINNIYIYIYIHSLGYVEVLSENAITDFIYCILIINVSYASYPAKNRYQILCILTTVKNIGIPMYTQHQWLSLPQAWGWPNVGSKHVAYVLINKECWHIWFYSLCVHSSTSWCLLSKCPLNLTSSNPFNVTCWKLVSRLFLRSVTSVLSSKLEYVTVLPDKLISFILRRM